MEPNWLIIILVMIALLAIIALIIKQNRKDKKDLIRELIKADEASIPKEKDTDDDTLDE
jgi:FtsZ-interacting cell division protein ZipA